MLERKATSRMGIVVFVSLATLDSAGSGERGRADSSNDRGEGSLVKDLWSTYLLMNQHPILKGGYHKKIYSFIGPLGYDIWREKHRNGLFGPKNGPKLQN